uniref:Endonuclease/exonuclease/phosphatase domain-containing protein n=1 Tax=Anopheles atroparvus TaxID=41427 RepID=A0AAG5DRI0_ANOAO
MPKYARLIQWNCRSQLSKIDLFKALVEVHHCDVFVLCETWLTPDSNLRVAGYNIIRQDRPSRGGGVLIGIKSSYTFSRIQIPSQGVIERVAIRAKIGDLNIAIASIYIPPEAKNNKGLINTIEKELYNLSSILPRPAFILGDFNSHGYEWGGNSEDALARIINDFCDKQGFRILNTGEATKIQTPMTRPSALDLSLCSASMMQSIKWKVIPDPLDSDHLPI